LLKNKLLDNENSCKCETRHLATPSDLPRRRRGSSAPASPGLQVEHDASVARAWLRAIPAIRANPRHALSAFIRIVPIRG